MHISYRGEPENGSDVNIRKPCVYFIINQPSEEKPPQLLSLPRWDLYLGLWFLLNPHRSNIPIICLNADGGMLGPEITSLFPVPPNPLAQAPDGLLLLNFLVEGAFSFLVHACSLGLSLSVPLPSPNPPTVVPGSGNTSSLRLGAEPPESHSHSPWGLWEWEQLLTGLLRGFLHVHFYLLNKEKGGSQLHALAFLSTAPSPVVPTETCQCRSMPSLLYFYFVLEGSG